MALANLLLIIIVMSMSGYIGFKAGKRTGRAEAMQYRRDEAIRRRAARSDFDLRKTNVIKGHAEDINRVREECVLTQSEEVFFRHLKRAMPDERILVLSRRFFICDEADIPQVVFVYSEGNAHSKTVYEQRGVPFVVYGTMPTSQELAKDFAEVTRI